MRAAVIGGGVIGAGWTARFLLHGIDVALYDPAPEAAARLDGVIEAARAALSGLYDVPLPVPGELTLAPTLEAAVRNARWIQESAPERLAVKQSVYAEIEASAPADAIIASSTSGFRPSELAEGLARPERLLVCHPFNPVYLLPLVEVVPATTTSERSVAAAMDLLTRVGMKPQRVRREIDAHIADRLLESVWREALWLVRDGIATTAEIDDVIRFGFGPRWAQMGLFETYRIGGGEAGMRHFLEQFAPALEWPWSHLTDVPEMTPELIATIAAQSDEQSGSESIAALEARRDANLVAIFRALKDTDDGVGALLNAWERHQ